MEGSVSFCIFLRKPSHLKLSLTLSTNSAVQVLCFVNLRYICTRVQKCESVLIYVKEIVCLVVYSYCTMQGIHISYWSTLHGDFGCFGAMFIDKFQCGSVQVGCKTSLTLIFSPMFSNEEKWKPSPFSCRAQCAELFRREFLQKEQSYRIIDQFRE